ncbi:MAG: hypothetical protein JO180_02855 [Gemmatirosa sp.]|nr:hypothetical protein [Gemmatirosa sp.]
MFRGIEGAIELPLSYTAALDAYWRTPIGTASVLGLPDRLRFATYDAGSNHVCYVTPERPSVVATREAPALADVRWPYGPASELAATSRQRMTGDVVAMAATRHALFVLVDERDAADTLGMRRLKVARLPLDPQSGLHVGDDHPSMLIDLPVGSDDAALSLAVTAPANRPATLFISTGGDAPAVCSATFSPSGPRRSAPVLPFAPDLLAAAGIRSGCALCVNHDLVGLRPSWLGDELFVTQTSDGRTAVAREVGGAWHVSAYDARPLLPAGTRSIAHWRAPIHDLNARPMQWGSSPPAAPPPNGVTAGIGRPSLLTHAEMLIAAVPAARQLWTVTNYGSATALPLVGGAEASGARYVEMFPNLLDQAIGDVDTVCAAGPALLLFGTRDSGNWRVLSAPPMIARVSPQTPPDLRS